MKKIYNFILPYLLIYKAKVILYIVITLLYSLVSLVSPLLNGYFIDYIMQTNNFKVLYHYAVLMMIILLLTLALNFSIQRLYTVIQSKISFALNKKVVKFLYKLSLSYTQEKDPIYFSQIINGDCNTIVSFSLTVIQEVIVNLFKLIIPFIIFINLNYIFGITFTLVMVLYYSIYLLFKKKLYDKSKITSEIKSRFFSILCAPVVSCKFYRLHEATLPLFKKIDFSFQEVLAKSLDFQVLKFLFSASDQVISTLMQIVLFVFGGTMLISGEITIGILTIILSYFSYFVASIKYFYSLGSGFQNILVSYDRLRLNLSQIPEKLGEQRIACINNVSINNLSFTYLQSNKRMSYPNMTFTKGNLYTLSGENGSGKTTLSLLLAGIYINEFEGEIEINGKSIQEIDMGYERRNAIAYAEQDSVLISDTLINNILIGLSDKKVENVIELNEKLGFFREDITWNRIINDKDISDHKNSLSGGECQKISIMRALLKDSSLIIMDEPTAFLDANSKKQLISYLSRIKKEKIIIVITHDVSFRAICDYEYEITSNKRI